MDNNSILRRLRYTLDASDDDMVTTFGLGGRTLTAPQVCALMAREEEEGVVECSDAILSDYLDGLILQRRGPRKPGSSAPSSTVPLTNNTILKKLRIAMNLREQDMLEMLKAGGQPLSRGELTALFRNPRHKHYRACGDQILRNFIKGLTQSLRG
jgi:uncharacterized protein YehS (DUF1456 family)